MLVGSSCLHLAPATPSTCWPASSAPPRRKSRPAAHEFGLDQPIYVQLLDYLANVARLNLGYSYRNDMSVVALIWTRLPATLLLMSTSIALSPSRSVSPWA